MEFLDIIAGGDGHEGIVQPVAIGRKGVGDENIVGWDFIRG